MRTPQIRVRQKLIQFWYVHLQIIIFCTPYFFQKKNRPNFFCYTTPYKKGKYFTALMIPFFQEFFDPWMRLKENKFKQLKSFLKFFSNPLNFPGKFRGLIFVETLFRHLDLLDGNFRSPKNIFQDEWRLSNPYESNVALWEGKRYVTQFFDDRWGELLAGTLTLQVLPYTAHWTRGVEPTETWESGCRNKNI